MTQKVFFAHRAISGRGGGLSFNVKFQCPIVLTNIIISYPLIIDHYPYK